MNKFDLMNIVSAAIKQYEKDSREVVGCFLRFETENKAPTSKGAFDWHTYQFDGTTFHDKENIEFKVVK